MLLVRKSLASVTAWPTPGRRTAITFACRHFSSSIKDPYRVLFFGTDDVSVATLRKLHANTQDRDGQQVVGHIEVVCPSDRKVGRSKMQDSVPVKRFALDHGIPVVHTPPHLKSLKNWDFPIKSEFDVGVVVSFGYFLHPHLLENLRHGAINMHPSLLPKYRGPAPIHHALMNGDSTTGVSVIEIDPRAFDVGRILLQQQFQIPPAVKLPELARDLSTLGADCVLETLHHLEKYKMNAVVQDDARASKAPKITLQDGMLQLNESASSIFHRWQALSDSVGVSIQYNGRPVKLIELRHPTTEELRYVEQETSTDDQVGTFFYDKPRQVFWLKCADKSWLLVTKLQQADRKIGGAIDFANGHRLKHGQRQQFERVTV